jgi:hypothetical protein
MFMTNGATFTSEFVQSAAPLPGYNSMEVDGGYTFNKIGFVTGMWSGVIHCSSSLPAGAEVTYVSGATWTGNVQFIFPGQTYTYTPTFGYLTSPHYHHAVQLYALHDMGAVAEGTFQIVVNLGNITMAGTESLPGGGHVHEWTDTPLCVGGEGSYLLLNSNTGSMEIPHAQHGCAGIARADAFLKCCFSNLAYLYNNTARNHSFVKKGDDD